MKEKLLFILVWLFFTLIIGVALFGSLLQFVTFWEVR